MMKKLVILLALSAVLTSGTAVVAQEPTNGSSAEGSLTLQNKNFTLKHTVAYETTTYDTDVIAVVLSGQSISGETVKKALEEEKAGNFPEFKKPYLRLEFTKAGELKNWSAATPTTTIGRRSSGKAVGELKLTNERAIGKASQPTDSEGMFPTAFNVRFDVALLKPGELAGGTARKAGPAANVKPTVTGTFRGNGKDANLAYVSAHWREPFSDQTNITLVFTEKDHSADKKPDTSAMFGKFGSALIISAHEDGSIFGCQVVHSAHSKQGFSSIGSIRTNDFEYAEGKVQGELMTDGQVNTFGETWEVNVKFVAPLGETPAEFQPKAKKTAPKPTADAEDEDDDSDSPAATSGIKAEELPLTKDASDIERKALVGQLAFKSKSGVEAVCAELAASLKAQGWKNDGSDLITPASGILKRQREGASLTIFVKPDAAGSDVKMMTEGLDWD